MSQQTVPASAGVARTTERPFRILCISHDARRAGAQLFLLNVIRWIRSNLPFEIQIVLARGGELESEFDALAPTWKIIDHDMSRADKIRLLMKRIFLFFRGSDRRVFSFEAASRIKREFRPDVIYANTVMVSEVVSKLASLGVPIVTHIHELDSWIRHRIDTERFSLLDRSTTHYIAVSHAVKENLERGWGISKERITVIHGFIPGADRSTGVDQNLSNVFRAELGITGDAVLVGGCGLQLAIKGTDFFLAVAREVLNRKTRKELRFVWLGSRPGNQMYWWLKHDVHRMGLDGYVQLLDVRKDTSTFFAAVDVFFLSSREDSFPLVCLEAASYAKPIVALSGAGGIGEFIGGDAGVMTPYLDVVAASDAILKLAEDPELRQAMGRAAKARVAANHSPEVGVGRIVDILRRVAGKGCT